jgi:hypothetical protein
MSKKKQIKHSENFSSNFDPNGSYTGNSKNGEKPIQDADDL